MRIFKKFNISIAFLIVFFTTITTQSLLSMGSEINIFNVLAGLSRTNPDIEVVRNALDQGVNPNREVGHFAGKLTALQRVLYSKPLTQLLLEHGALPDSLSKYSQRTALHEAVVQSNSHVIPILLQHGARIDFPDHRETALDATSRSSLTRSLKVLMREAKTRLTEDEQKRLLLQALFKAIRTGNIPAAEVILRQPLLFSDTTRYSYHNNRPIYNLLKAIILRALKEGFTELFPFFYLWGIDFDQSAQGCERYFHSVYDLMVAPKASPLEDNTHLARAFFSWEIGEWRWRKEAREALAPYFQQPLDKLLLKHSGQEEKFSNLLKKLKLKNRSLAYSFELLLYNLHKRRFAVVLELLEQHPLSIKDSYTALERIRLLIEYLERSFASLEEELNPSKLEQKKAIYNSIEHIRDKIKEHLYGNLSSDDLLWKALNEQSYRLAQESIERGASVDSCDSDNNTPLHSAAQKSNQLLIELLLEHGAKIAAVNKAGQTPEHLARENGHTSCADYLKYAAGEDYIPQTRLVSELRNGPEADKKSIRKLLKDGREVNFPLDYRRNALDVAYDAHCSFEVMQLLIKYGAQSKRGLSREEWLREYPQLDAYQWTNGHYYKDDLLWDSNHPDTDRRYRTPENLEKLNLYALNGDLPRVEEMLKLCKYDITGTSLLSYAVASGNKELVFLLLEKANVGYDQLKQARSIGLGISLRACLTKEQKENYRLIVVKLIDMCRQALGSF